jgi:hypothetical protein
MTKTAMPVYSHLCPFLNNISKLCTEGSLREPDFVGAVIIAYASTKKSRWISSRLNEPIVCIPTEVSCQSAKLLSVPGLDKIIDLKYVLRKLGISSPDNATILSIFNQLGLAGMKHNSDNYINKSIVYWALGLRPYKLLYYVPTPMEVLRMQALGQRVITVFLKPEELDRKHVAKLYYMEGKHLPIAIICCT